MAGSVPLPEAAAVLAVDFDEEADTVGGWFVAMLGRFPQDGDVVEIAEYRVTVSGLKGHKVASVRFEKDAAAEDHSAVK
jgi:CBS domain containing-hemolysin-like protein